MGDEGRTKPSGLQDFLEKYVADGFKRELDLEEAVWRSIPALVTALALLGAGAVYLFRQIVGNWSAGLAVLPATALLALATAGIGLAAWHLRFAVKKRKHRYPPDEVAICKWLAVRKKELSTTTSDTDEVEATMLREVRATVLSETAAAASWNHEQNVAKLKGRTESARWIFLAAMLMLFAEVAFTLSGVRQSEPEHEQRARSSASASASASAATDPRTGAEVGGEGQHDLTHPPLTIAGP